MESILDVMVLGFQRCNPTPPLDLAQASPPLFQDKAGYPITSLSPVQHWAKQSKINPLHSAHTTRYNQNVVDLCKPVESSLRRSNTHLRLEILKHKSKSRQKLQKDLCLWTGRSDIEKIMLLSITAMKLYM